MQHHPHNQILPHSLLWVCPKCEDHVFPKCTARTCEMQLSWASSDLVLTCPSKFQRTGPASCAGSVCFTKFLSRENAANCCLQAPSSLWIPFQHAHNSSQRLHMPCGQEVVTCSQSTNDSNFVMLQTCQRIPRRSPATYGHESRTKRFVVGAPTSKTTKKRSRDGVDVNVTSQQPIGDSVVKKWKLHNFWIHTHCHLFHR